MYFPSVAQSGSAIRLGRIGRGFEASHSDQWGCSSVGRAPALQAGGHRFEPVLLHHLFHSSYAKIAFLFIEFCA